MPNEESGVSNRAEGTNVRIKINNKGEAVLGYESKIRQEGINACKCHEAERCVPNQGL